MKQITMKQLKKLITEDIDDEIAPCENCGSNNVSVIEYPTVKFNNEIKGCAYYVKCHSCGKKSTAMFNKNEAIEYWNSMMNDIANGIDIEESDF